MKNQYWCSDCGYLWVVDIGDGVPEECPKCNSKRVIFKMSVVNNRVYVSKRAHEANRYV